MVDVRKAQARAARRRAAERAVLIAAYREEMRRCCITIICDADGARVRIVASGNDELDAEVGTQARLWCRRPAEAERVATAARAPLRRLKFGEDARSPAALAAGDSSLLSRACGLVSAAAQRCNVVLRADAEFTQEVSRAVASIDAEVEKARQNGELKALNEAYKKYRREAKARGEPAMRYDEWMLKFREDLVRKAAREVRDR